MSTINEFLLHLSHCGRSVYTLRSYARGLTHFFGWLHTTKRNVDDVTSQTIETYIAFLLAVSVMPFSTALLAAFITYRLALVAYWLNILLPGAVLFGSWRYAQHAGLMKDEMTVEMLSANERRIVIGQALYALGALLCVFSTYWSIVFIVLVQLNYAIAPRIRLLYRL